MASRWDFLFDQKPVPLREHLLEEASKLLAKELLGWPLPVLSVEVETGRRFAALLEPTCRPPPPALYEEAFRLTDWELGRELQAVDDYMRNRRWLEPGLAPEHKDALLFVSRWLLEQLLSLREETQSRLTRADLQDLLGRIARRWRAERPTGG